MNRRLVVPPAWTSPVAPDEAPCPICGRPIPPAQLDRHHWVPKTKGGRETGAVHRICHRQIHALFSENELARHYATPQALAAHPDVQRFVAWVRNKPDGFSERVRRPRARR